MIHKLLSSALGGQNSTSRYTSGYRNKSVHSIERQREGEYRVEMKKSFSSKFLQWSEDRSVPEHCFNKQNLA